MREFANIGQGFAEFGNIGGFDVATIVKACLGIFETIRESATWKFIIVMSNIGEQAAKSELDKQKPTWAGPNASAFRGKNMIAPPSMDTRRAMSRVSRGDRQFASPISISDFTSFLLPNQQYDAKGTYLSVSGSTLDPTAQAFTTSGHAAVSQFGSSVRIPAEWIQKFEEQLNSEYCPFYIQDLRNNEIVNMPAFISSLNDNFQPEYSSTNGYGRTDPVRVYTRTTRQIQIGFKMVAMSKEDHEHMWFSINRLVTMLYPQRSLGRLVKTKGGGQYIQPFSSVPTTTPLVRLRLGDLYRSNFSDSAFARMLGHPGLVVNPGSDLSDADRAKLAGLGKTIAGKIAAARSEEVKKFNAIKNMPGNNAEKLRDELKNKGYKFKNVALFLDQSDIVDDALCYELKKSAPLIHCVASDRLTHASPLSAYCPQQRQQNPTEQKHSKTQEECYSSSQCHFPLNDL